MEAAKVAFNTAETTRSPIILDLDGDGVETTNVEAGAYFDHDSNGFAERSAWVSRDDGLLVLDRDGNGTIDSGAELFGNETVLADGSKASNGFEALRELDSNQDGKVDANDAAFANLKVWKDADGDGYTAQGELVTLAEVGIESISVGYTNSTFVDAQGNEHKQAGTYARNDGTSAMAADVWFQSDVTQTLASEWLDIAPDIAVLPDATGYGNVYDLHQAMARDATGGLKALIDAFAAATTVSQREGLLEQILYKWTASENINPSSRGGHIDARKLSVVEKFMAEEFLGTWCWGTRNPNPHSKSASILMDIYRKVFDSYYGILSAQTHLKDLYDVISESRDQVTQSFKVDLLPAASALRSLIAADREAGKDKLSEFIRTLRQSPALDSMNTWEFQQAFGDLGTDVVAVSNSAWAGLVATIGNDSLRGGIGTDYLNGRSGDDYLAGDAGNDTLIGESGNDMLDGGTGDDVLEGGLDNDTLSGGTGNDLYLFGSGSGQDQIIENDATAGNVDTVRFAQGIGPEDIKVTRDHYNLYIEISGTTDRITLANWYLGDQYRIERVEFADGTARDSQQLESKLVAGTASEGADYLVGNATGEVIDGLGGNDFIFGNDGNDTLAGGAGNDYLDGGAGNDVYMFGRGAGRDIAYDFDATPGNIDSVQLSADVAPGDVTFTRDASHLYLRINGTTDILTLQGWFDSDASKIEEIRFADGTIWDLPAILARLPVATEAADTLYGLTSADSITGLGGNDTVYALGGNDIVDGGAGNDRLEGGNGDDALAGGAGDDMLIGGEGTDLLHGESANDTLDGGAGNDIYRFGRGSGLDTVRDADSTAGNVDVIRLDADILPPDVRVSRDQWNLYPTINGTDDKLILEDWFQDDASKVEHVEFADGTVWDVAALLTKASTPTEDSDYLAGTSSADTLLGLGGDDQL
ncbi:MAG: calcium-binding protein [Gammaproteobacteria bacterium]